MNRNHFVRITLWFSGLTVASALSVAGATDDCLAYFGTYTKGSSKGIYVSHLNLTTGELTSPALAAEVANPSFLALHPSGQFLYAVSEIWAAEGKRIPAVSSLSIDKTAGTLTLLNQQPAGGAGPCHVTVDKTGKCVLVANYGGGSLSAYPVDADGRLGAASTFIQHQGSSVDPNRQKDPHAHAVGFDPANRFAFCTDLGLDKVLIYRFDPTKATIVPNDPPSAPLKPGSGPRHFAFHPNGRYCYVINEMASTITGFTYDATCGALTEFQTIATLPTDFTGNNTTAEIEVHPTGKFLYGSNRGHDSIALYAIDQRTGKLRFVEHESSGGKAPRNFSIDPTGKFLLAANQNTDNIVVFRIDPKTGRLTPTGQSISVGAPVCVVFLR